MKDFTEASLISIAAVLTEVSLTPDLVSAKTERVLPRRVKDLIDIEDPQCAKLRTLAAEPILAIDLRLKLLYTCANSTLLTALPSLANERIENEDERLALPATLK
jgi:hypothetical protein